MKVLSELGRVLGLRVEADLNPNRSSMGRRIVRIWFFTGCECPYPTARVSFYHGNSKNSFLPRKDL